MRYRVTRTRTIACYTYVEAGDWEEAENKARELDEEEWQFNENDIFYYDWDYNVEEEEE